MLSISRVVSAWLMEKIRCRQTAPPASRNEEVGLTSPFNAPVWRRHTKTDPSATSRKAKWIASRAARWSWALSGLLGADLFVRVVNGHCFRFMGSDLSIFVVGGTLSSAFALFKHNADETIVRKRSWSVRLATEKVLHINYTPTQYSNSTCAVARYGAHDHLVWLI